MLLKKASGAMYIGDPTLISVKTPLYFNENYLEKTAKPKSAILAFPSLTRMLAIFMSRWIIFFLYK